MTGKDLIIYILANNLENKQVFENGKLLGFMTEEEAAVKFEVGVATVRTWARIKVIECLEIGGRYYIPANTESPMNGTIEYQLSFDM